MTVKKHFKLTEIPGALKLSDPQIMLATWFGSGLLNPAPGTWGTLAALPFGYAIAHFFGIWGLATASLLCFTVGIIVCDYYQHQTGRHDAKEVVIDEVAGMWLAAIPAGTNIALWVLAFLLFRLFDITKPWPASYFDKQPEGGIHVMMDDIVAGVFAFLGVATCALGYMNFM